MGAFGGERRWGRVSLGFAATGALLTVARSSGTFHGLDGGVERAGPRLWKTVPAELNRKALGDDGGPNGGQWRSLLLPNVERALEDLAAHGELSAGSSADERAAAVKRHYAELRKRHYVGPDPFAARQLLARERALLSNAEARSGAGGLASVEGELLPPEFLGSPEKTVLGVVVEFAPPGGSETIARVVPIDPADPTLGCTSIEQTFGALSLGDDPPPGPLDNFNFFKPDITVDDYRSVFFGVGPDAGYGVVRPDLGGINLTGLSLNNYLLEMSRDTYTTGGDILDTPVVVPHAHEYYGYAEYAEDETGACVPTPNDDVNYGQYIEDVLQALTEAYDGVVDFSEFDADGDHIVDLLATIHAGYSWQTGGGEDRLSTSSSGLFIPQQVSGFGTPDDTSDDYYVSGYNIDPEQLALGAVQEEFEHQFGLPDLYATDLSNSNAWWGAHSAGVWGGPLAGARPVGHNLWQDWVLGWRHPIVIDYDDPRLLSGRLRLDIGRARYTPEGLADGVIVRLPDTEVPIDNLAGSGAGWHSGKGDLLDNRVSRSFDLSAASGPITFAFASQWDIELDFDYGLIEFSSDGGATWITLPDQGGILTDQDPNGVGVVAPGVSWGLTGSGSANLSFDLSAFAGTTLGVRLRYLTDPAVENPGWHVDDLLLSDASGALYANDLETDFSDWTNAGWLVTPYIETFPRYYLFEWRDDGGYDASLHEAYNIAYSSPIEPPPEVTVDRLSYTTPGLVVAIRDTQQEFDYTLGDDLIGGNSIGPKFAHLVVESHPEPLRFDTPDPTRGEFVGINLNGGILAGDAAFGLTRTAPWTARRLIDPATGIPAETKSWDSRGPVRSFHDSYGYYPGLFLAPDGSFYFHDIDASAVLPTKAPYSTRITDVDGNAAPELYGDLGGGIVLGTGNPGDDQVHFGLHASVVTSGERRATIEIWNRPFEVVVRSVSSPLGSSSGSGTTLSLELAENIGGRLLDAALVVELPPGVEYLPGSASGGLTPVEPGFGSSQAVADRLSRGALTQHDRSDVRYLVWRSDVIPTTAGVPPFAFSYRAKPGTSGSIRADLFKNSNELFQTERIAVGSPEQPR
jgi:immune inhibitor A